MQKNKLKKNKHKNYTMFRKSSSTLFCFSCFIRLFEDIILKCSRKPFSKKPLKRSSEPFYKFLSLLRSWEYIIEFKIKTWTDRNAQWRYEIMVICCCQTMWLALGKIKRKAVFLLWNSFSWYLIFYQILTLNLTKLVLLT